MGVLRGTCVLQPVFRKMARRSSITWAELHLASPLHQKASPQIIIKRGHPMYKPLLQLTCASALLFALPTWACSLEEATAKREELAALVTQLTEQDPQKAKEINEELQAMKLDSASADLPDKCQLIERRMQELKTAEKRAG